MPRPDADLLARLLDQHGGALALYAAQWTDSADDCVQEALVELARQTEAPENTVGWLYRVVKNRALNAARGHNRRREREAEAWRRRLVGEGPADSDRADLLEAVERLPVEQRELIVLRVWGGLSFAEIAEATEVAVSTAHRKYQEAIDSLRQQWNEPCRPPTPK
jgi:RNA polymerase sigma-70 factor (ECF subfamily)